MDRKAIIITGHPNDENDKKTDIKYLNHYYSFFTSNSGGAYEDDEILIYQQPTVFELKSLTTNFTADYAVIVLIGHGATIKDNQVFQINENEIIKTGQLEIYAEKQLIIIESCRNINNEISPIDLSDKLPKFQLGGTKRSPISRNEAKKLYKNEILKCKNGLTVCLACSKFESAWNYFFSDSLIQNGFDWHLSSQNHFKTLGIIELMNLVKKNVRKISKNKIDKVQNPEVIGTENFPFVVSKF